MADPAQFTVIINGQFGVLPSGHLAIFNASSLACECCNDPPCDPDWGDSKGPTSGTVIRDTGVHVGDQHQITVEAGADYYASATITNNFNQNPDAPGTMSTTMSVEENPTTGDAFAIIASTTFEIDEWSIGFFYYPAGLGGAAVLLWDSGIIGFQPNGLWQIEVTPTTVYFTGSIYEYEYTRDPPDASRKCEVVATLGVQASEDQPETAMEWANFILKTPIPTGV